MNRISLTPRQDWQRIVSEQGLIYHTPNGRTYWDESACYSFTAAEVDALETATNALHAMCLEAGQFVIDNNRFSDLAIPASVVPAIREIWEAEPPAIYGRFDFSFDGSSLKMLEYNADTPTSLLEASVIQWFWLKDVMPSKDQFNSIHERLIAKWKDLAPSLPTRPLYFGHADDMEDKMTVSYLRDTAEQAGIQTQPILMADIGWNSAHKCFVDLAGHPIGNIFKLYPWEWLVHEEFGIHAIETMGRMRWIEPVWKMMFSNKGLLAVLWEMYPGHPNLLEAHLDGPRDMFHYVRKPKLSREGSNVRIYRYGIGAEETPGDYGEDGFVYQALAELPNFGGNRPVIGSWVIDGSSAGMGIRESSTAITDNLSRFVPHYIE